MSDILPDQVLKKLNFERFKNSTRVDTNRCLKYVCRDSATDKNVILAAHCRMSVLDSAQQEALRQEIPCSYTKIFNAFLYETTGFKLRNDSQRLEE